MEIIKRKIALDDYTSREDSNWGKLTATTFNVNIFFTQDGDDMGISTEMPFIAKGDYSTYPNNTTLLVDYTPLTPKLTAYTFNFMTGGISTFLQTGEYPSTRYPNKALNQYFIKGMLITGLTEDKLATMTSYDASDKFKLGFDIDRVDTHDYQNVSFTGASRIISNSNLDPITYLSDGDVSPVGLSTLPNPQRGVYYTTTTATTRIISGTIFGKYEIPYTEMRYTSEGFNDTNVHLSAETKEDYLFGITSTPTVFNDLFIDRGRATVIQSHMQLSEIRNMSELINYGNGFYNLRRY